MPVTHGKAAHKSFVGASGGGEHYIAVDAPAGLPFAQQLAAIEDRYARALAELGLGTDTAVFRRIFLSDAANQEPAVQVSMLAQEQEDCPIAVSIIQQPPLSGAKIALLAYHVRGGTAVTRRRLTPKHLLIEKNGTRHLWTTQVCPGGNAAAVHAARQTRDVFDDLVGILENQGATLLDHCVRTWIYVKDVDVFYKDIVDSRTELFLERGLTPDTHFISSTGIEGACAHQFDLVVLDAYSILDLAPGQMSFLYDFDHMCPTQDYNVTFERGTRIAYADRAHHFISGTASIDRSGAVLHSGDVIAQLERALENVDAILHSGGASLDDMMYWIVYLRDPGDHGIVKNYLDTRFPGMPMAIVHGPVCRTDWLIEVEGIAIAKHGQPDLPGF